MATPLQLSPPFPAASFLSNKNFCKHYTGSLQPLKSTFKNFSTRAIKEKTDSSSSSSSSAEDITKKYGLEAGLWQIFSTKEERKEGDGETKKSKGDQAKELLAKYGGAYLATSITLSFISFSLCYALINAGIDVQALLQKVGISTDATGEKVGTFALAYAAHKAASPIRFPPTVALTPIVATWIGKKVDKEKESP
ncbi:uncharacterized protein LOC8263329 [Ricinus communis]|uniref:DUF1279 domain-containing protein n=1 Tax=Ricinus communis TaxID=3988 RepID=B9SCZ5_RICCO|nr:uncharacterized protein LOC8263329 [Ricinus communis]EEF38590.1 conserved hypothetical protein [Ricinus communis]|eukprot:XP_002523864.1 uncharacterized protein LOC8263329 [Ricinus communis]